MPTVVDLLRSEIRRTVNLYYDEPTQRQAIVEALSRPGFALHPESPCRAGRLTLDVYRSIRGSLSPVALQAAAAVELQMEAAYMFDRVADGEVEPEHGLSAAEELALALALLTCGAAVACEAAHQARCAGSSLGPLRRFHRNGIDACAGQFLDAYLGKLDQATTEEALNMTCLKSGSIGRFAAAFGASVATDDAETIDLSGDFGFNVFTYLQLVDDLRDAFPPQGPLTDLMQHKKTVPLVFFYNYVAERRPQGGDGIMQPLMWKKASREFRQEFEASGAEAFGAIVAEAFFNRAKANLEELEERLGTVENLGQLVDSLEINHQELLAVA